MKYISRLQLPESIPMVWVMAGVLGLVFSVGIISEVLLFGGGSEGEQAVLGTSPTPTTSPTRTPGQTDPSSVTAAESPTLSATPVVTAPQPPAASVAPTQTAPPPQTSPPTAIPVTPPPLAPTPTPPTPGPAGSETWPEVAEGFRNTQNAYYETVKTYGETTFPGVGTLPSTDQFYLTFCQVEADNSELRYWVIACSFGVLTTITAEACLPDVGCFTPEPEYEPLGIRQFRLWWDSGEVEQL